MQSYAHPEVLVSTDWVARHRADPSVRNYNEWGNVVGAPIERGA